MLLKFIIKINKKKYLFNYQINLLRLFHATYPLHLAMVFFLFSLFLECDKKKDVCFCELVVFLKDIIFLF